MVAAGVVASWPNLRFGATPVRCGQWIVAMEQIQVDGVELEAGQRIVQIGSNVKWRDALAIHIVMRALADDNHLVAYASFVYPAPHGPLVVAAAAPSA